MTLRSGTARAYYGEALVSLARRDLIGALNALTLAASAEAARVSALSAPIRSRRSSAARASS